MTNISQSFSETKAPARPSLLGLWVPLALAPAAVYLLTAARLPRWGVMWAVTASIFTVVKWSSWAARPAECALLSRWRAAAYLFCWPGLNPRPFASLAKVARPMAREWGWAVAKLGFGAALIWLVSPQLLPLGRAWAGMAGIVFVLHFGAFHLLALAFQALGIPVQPLMRNPAAAVSLGEFWGARWNRGWRDWAHRLLFLPAEARFGRTAAALWVYLASGLIHEAAISLPAGAGYGGPVSYFALQGAGTWLERSRLGRRAGLRRGWRGRAFTLAVTVLPVGLLFHRPFALRVIVPFLKAIGAKL